MARPRKSPHLKNQPITISLPPQMIAEIDETLSYKANRSKWIQGAIEIKLSGVEKPSPNQLAAQFYNLLQNNKDALRPNILELIIAELE